MSLPVVTTTLPEQKNRVSATLLMAFAADPFMRWLFPNGSEYINLFPSYLESEGFSLGFKHGSVYATEEFEGVSFWLPPNVHADEQKMVQWMTENLRPEILPDLMRIGERVDQAHDSCGPCWYLAYLGVDSAYQGHGFGSVLLKKETERLDEAGETAYLESSNPQNLSLYERHGFERIDEIALPGTPVITPMIRTPRT